MEYKFIIIQTINQGIFITDNVDDKQYHNSLIPKLIFDNKVLEESKKKNWYKINKLPEKIEVKQNSIYTNQRYELLDGYPISNRTPKTILNENIDDYPDILGLYTYKYDIIESPPLEVKFEYDLIKTGEIFEGTPKYKYTNNIIDELITKSDLLVDKECKIEGPDLYDIIREYIKNHIDNKVGQIIYDNSEYMLVQKKIQLNESITQKIENIIKKKSLPLIRTLNDKRVDILKISKIQKEGYTLIEGVKKSNYKLLEEYIDSLLIYIIGRINEPLKECKCCKGSGVELIKGSNEIFNIYI